jgi:hypothetical protein
MLTTCLLDRGPGRQTVLLHRLPASLASGATTTRPGLARSPKVRAIDALLMYRSTSQLRDLVTLQDDAHELVGLPFPVQDPANAWDVIRAQMDVAFGSLQEQILAAR